MPATLKKTFANIAFVAVENVKVIGKVAKGEMTVQEGLNKMEQIVVSTVAGIAATAKGTTIGATVGSVFGPAGVAIGGFIGGTIGYTAGSAAGEAVVKGVQKIREKARDVVKRTGNRILTGTVNVLNSVKNLLFT